MFIFFKKAPIALLKADMTSTSISPQYVNFIVIFSKDPAAELPEHTEINDHIINLIRDY